MPSGPQPRTTTVSPPLHHLVQPVRDRHRLGEHRHLVGHLVRHPEERRAGEQVHPLGPAAPQTRRPRQRQRVAVVLEPLAHEVRLAAQAPPAAPARDVRRRHDPRADLEHVAELVDEPRAVAELGEHADVLVPADQRVVDACSCGVPAYCRLSPRNVCLSVPQMPDRRHVQNAVPGSGPRIVQLPQLDPVRRRDDRRPRALRARHKLDTTAAPAARIGCHKRWYAAPRCSPSDRRSHWPGPAACSLDPPPRASPRAR